MSIKRYALVQGHRMMPDPVGGAWVFYDDHVAEVERLDGVIAWQAGIIDGHAEDMMRLEDARDEARAALEDAYREGYEQHSVDSVYQDSGPDADAAWNTSGAKRFAALPTPPLEETE